MKFYLFRYDPRAGTYVLEREVTPATAQDWLERFQRDAPSAKFLVASRRPQSPAEKTLKQQARARRSRERVKT